MWLLVCVLRDSSAVNQNFQTAGDLFFAFTECLFNISRLIPKPLNTPTLHINQVYGSFTLWHSVGWPTRCGLGSHQFLFYTVHILSFSYVASISSSGILLIANFMNICQVDTISYGENHGAWLYRKSTRFTFYKKTAEKQVSYYPAIFTYSLQYPDPTLRDVYREIIAFFFSESYERYSLWFKGKVS